MRNVPLALLKHPWMMIDIPRQLREAARSNATVSSSVQVVPESSNLEATHPLNPLVQHEKDLLRATACALPQHDPDGHDQNAKAIFHEDNTSVIVIPTRNYYSTRTSFIIDTHDAIDDAHGTFDVDAFPKIFPSAYTTKPLCEIDKPLLDTSCNIDSC